jgi:hypothetical protein
MYLVADVKCYYCGFISGELVSPSGQSLKNGTFRPAAGVETAETNAGRLRCVRCGGPVFLDEVRTERPRPTVTFFERERPGRPRKVQPGAKPARRDTARPAVTPR